MMTTEDRVKILEREMAKYKALERKRAKRRLKCGWIGWALAGAAITLGIKDWKDIPEKIETQVSAEVTRQVAPEVAKQLPMQTISLINEYAKDALGAKDRAENAATGATESAQKANAALGKMPKLTSSITIGNDNDVHVWWGAERANGQREWELYFIAVDPSVPGNKGRVERIHHKPDGSVDGDNAEFTVYTVHGGQGPWHFDK